MLAAALSLGASGARPDRATAGDCATEPMRRTGSVYYFCDCGAGAAPGCVPGEDTNAGTSPAAPKRTGFKQRFTTMAAGDTVALCRGGSFANDVDSTRNSRCRAAKTCDLRDYVAPWNEGGEGRPILVGGRIGFFPDDGSSHYEGFRFFNLESTRSLTTQGPFFMGGNVNDVDICNVHVHDGDIGVFFADPVGSQPLSRRWTVRSSRFERLSSQGFLGGCTDCVLDGNYFGSDSYGPNSFYDHPLYISSPTGHRVERMKVTNNEVHGCRPGTTKGTALIVVHGHHEDLLLENNLVQCDHPAGVSPHQWGISINHGSYPPSHRSSYARTVVRRNRVVDQVGIGIELSQAPDSVVEANIVVMASNASGSSAIHAGHYRAREGAADAANERVTIRNNTVHHRGAAKQDPNVGVRVTGEGRGYVITNNVAHYGGRGGLTRCFDLQLPAAAYALASNNACNGTWGTAHDATRVVFDGDPFVKAGTNFTPAPRSPLVDLATTRSCSPQAIGTVSWTATDRGRTRGARPDIGAHER